ncbi:uncharacterized protein LOC117145636 [Drosophila mauritiana]|uniref:Uncharacterized protein LOC117145636 n=1 Tax=Drosophila mauritiana TaxID=7226 RepID=A0A6P8KVN4_DROMA|nr:uncharacterized protein LOC117145636 [Drosophila mauritiana]
MQPIKFFLFLVILIIHNACGLIDNPNYDSHSPLLRKIRSGVDTSKQLISFTDLNVKESSDDAKTYNNNPMNPFFIRLSVPVLKTLAKKKP